ncbi:MULTISPECIES: rhodanese-like domain-containing protein [unclassified Flavobacterium]|uniref:rhodanese-like domain-containing protein n=1 Tax=unclassified Flavobacterium TaxID=196869 RepID=UPI001F09FAE4|nr:MULTISPECIES: rhodanese-like domain-containing protein [unclassified Flavobacterium]
MSKQSIKIVLTFIALFIMFGLIKNMFLDNSNNQELRTVIQNKAFLVDVRTPSEFASGHVEGSVNIPLDQVLNQLQMFQNHENIVVFCKSGNRSGQAFQMLKANGFNNVTNGGTWQQVKKVQTDLKSK